MTDTAKEPVLIIMFGATGDLACRKLYPALFELYKKRHEFAVIGLARRQHTHESYRSMIDRTLRGASDQRQEFLDRFYYLPLDVSAVEHFYRLKRIADQIDSQYHLGGNRIYYLSLAPRFFGQAAQNLKSAGLTETAGWKRAVIEKPFGHDLASAKALNKELLAVFREPEIYRIDHYLGKEMVQNIEALRFANPIFESIWNYRHIANVQITLSETLGVGDRASYYDQTGALLDMVQNHILQLMILTAMEPPSRFDTEDVRQEKVKVLKAIRPLERENIAQQIVRAQYKAGVMPDGTRISGYHGENNIDASSTTETFIAARFFIDNYRWSGVPFYVRTGKRMAAKSTEIVIQFKDIPQNPFFYELQKAGPNLLVIHIQPDEGLSLKLNVKEFGESGATLPISMNFSNHYNGRNQAPEAYERLLGDCLRGDSTNFTRWDEVAYSWILTDSIVAAWDKIPLDYYEAGTMGPDASDELLARDGFCWWPLTKME
ncbi:MAG: glucose-6-phosphate dehydrogenase [Sporolactobacillus sp.]